MHDTALVNQQEGPPPDWAMPAAWLDGELPVNPYLQALSDDEVWSELGDRHQEAVERMFHTCDVLVDCVRRAGTERTARAAVLAEAGQALNLHRRSIYGMFLFGRIFPPSERGDGFAGTLHWGHFDETVVNLKMSETPLPEAIERAKAVIAVTHDRDLTTKKTRRLAHKATELHATTPEEVEALAVTIFDAEPVETEPEPEPEALASLAESAVPTPQAERVRIEATVESLPDFEQLLNRFQDGLSLSLYKIYGNTVDDRTRSAFSEMARGRARAIFGPYLEAR